MQCTLALSCIGAINDQNKREQNQIKREQNQDKREQTSNWSGFFFAVSYSKPALAPGVWQGDQY